MTTALEEFLSHINRRISILETELERLQQVRSGISEGRGASSVPQSSDTQAKDRKAA